METIKKGMLCRMFDGGCVYFIITDINEKEVTFVIVNTKENYANFERWAVFECNVTKGFLQMFNSAKKPHTLSLSNFKKDYIVLKPKA